MTYKATWEWNLRRNVLILSGIYMASMALVPNPISVWYLILALDIIPRNVVAEHMLIFLLVSNDSGLQKGPIFFLQG